MTLTDTTKLKKGQAINVRGGRTGFFRELTGTGVGTKLVLAEAKGSRKTFEVNFRQALAA